MTIKIMSTHDNLIHVMQISDTNWEKYNTQLDKSNNSKM